MLKKYLGLMFVGTITLQGLGLTTVHALSKPIAKVENEEFFREGLFNIKEPKVVLEEWLIEQENIKKEQEVLKKLEETRIVRNPIFDFNNVRVKSGLNKKSLELIIKGNKVGNAGKFLLLPLAETIIQCEKEYGINALFLLGIISQESGYGTSYLARSYNNLMGILKANGSPMYFDSQQECVEYMAKVLDREYLTKGGDYYSSSNSIYSINKYYCVKRNSQGVLVPDYSWSDYIIQIANNYKKIKIES